MNEQLDQLRVRSQTHYKFAEASFFLLRANENWRNVPEFDFYLSAFISAARSVTWVMRAEFGKMAGWADWFEARKPTPDIEDLLNKTASIRNRSQKSKPIATRTTVSLNVPGMSPEEAQALTGAKDVHLVPVDSRNEEFWIVRAGKKIGVGRIQKAKHELPEFPGEHALGPCERYLVFLHELVDECLIKFHPAAKGAKSRL
jgi:hypothetical protein